MANFTITFNNNKEIKFVDNTDYSALTVTKTDLVVTYPSITGGTPITLDLYDENIGTLGDSYDFIIANEGSLTTLIDGVYQFTLNILNGVSIVDTAIIYVINDYEVFNCLRSKTDSILDKECDDKWCQYSSLVALLNTAKREAADGLYTSAQEIMDYLASECNGC